MALDKHPAGIDVGDSVSLLVVNHANSRARLHNMYQKVRSALAIEKLNFKAASVSPKWDALLVVRIDSFHYVLSG